ncbi:MAG: hypothetical protein RL885_11575 [Planctomycetota bacterium]
MSTTHTLRCLLCRCPRHDCDCPECPACQDVVEPECREHQPCWYCGEPSERLSEANACPACERDALERANPERIVREAHVGARQLLSWVDEYNRDSGGPVTALMAHVPEIGHRVEVIVRRIRDAASELETVLYGASVAGRKEGGQDG